MTSTAEEVIARVPMWAGLEEIRVSPLGGGITNHNFKVDVQGKSYALRIAGENTDLLGINREFEYSANLAAGKLGLAPEVVYFIRPEGYLITRFINGDAFSPKQIREPDNIQRVAELLKQIHHMPEIPGTFSAFQVVKDYSKIAHRYKVDFPQNFHELIMRMKDAESVLRLNPDPPQPCHNDLLLGNFISNGPLLALDWEYAGMGDIFFDLANFSDNHELSEEQDLLLLGAYFGEVTKSISAHFGLMKIMSDFREAMWGLVQTGISQLDFDFRAYAGRHFQRLTQNIQDPRWDQWLKEVTNNV
jgi:thiamine kinase-like enzyme